MRKKTIDLVRSTEHWRFKLPWTDMHQLNLDWLLDAMKDWSEKMNEEIDNLEALEENLVEEWEDFRTSLNTAWTEFQTEIIAEWTEFRNDVNTDVTSFKNQMDEKFEDFFDHYIETLGVVQETGSSTTDVMSQKAVTDELNKTNSVLVNLESKNLLNENDPNYKDGYFISTNGVLSQNANYIASGFIPVEAGDVIQASYITASGNQAVASMRYICAYDASKNALSDKGSSTATETFIIPDGVHFIRASYYKASYGYDFQIEKSNHGFTTYSEYAERLLVDGEKINVRLHCYMPKMIYVAVGRTIEIYNNQICLEADKYNVQWICPIGNAYERKFSVQPTAQQLGNKLLRMVIYDDDLNEVWSGSTTLKVVANSHPSANILSIGDSLTNWKRWLPEVKKLSNNNINFVGTRESGIDHSADGTEYAQGTIHHEGRSGWSAMDYLEDSTYTFDSRYSGAPDVLGTVNPFWDGEKFSYSYYLTKQGDYIDGTPNAIQIFLGTNGMSIDPTENANAIIELVNKIREDNATIPIFVINTIYRSTQDGYVSTGGEGYSGSASAFSYNENVKVINLMNALREPLSQIANVYVIPLALMHDTKYNFGQKTVFVNPRSEITKTIPIESVHPQAQGYFQMADVFYSAYCAVL